MPEKLQRKAVECGFYKRSSKLLPAKFFDLLLHSASINGQFSLSKFSCEAAVSSGISITKQALDGRFDQTAVSFVKSVLEDQLNNQIGQTLEADFLKKFGRVRIKDSTRFDLPDRLKDKFPGFGGKITSEAGTSIQYEFDIKNGKMLDLDITSVKRTDYQDAGEKVSDIEKGDLVIRDLGYFSSDVLKQIMIQEAFFLSRLKMKMLVFDEDLNEISFSKLYTRMTKNNFAHTEMKVLIGKKGKVPVRLIIDIIPDEVYQKRLRIIEKENKKKGCKTSDEYKIRARFNLLITNVETKDLPSEQVYCLYKIRWQIELIFKTWKSVCGIHKIHPMSYHRLMCLLYAKFILILINNQIINLLQCNFYKRNNALLSRSKCFSTLMNYFYKTREVLNAPKRQIVEYMHEIAALLSKNHWLEKRKDRVNYVEIIELFTLQSNN
jgi:hypothetical protein